MSKQNHILKENFNLLAEALKSIGHPERIAIVNLICSSKENRMTVKSIYGSLKMEQPIVSRHLGILKRCGILERKTEGVNTFYCLCENNKIAEQIYKCLCVK
ncbi:MAG: ArsR family transcriptional regulator [Bacteroidetes bacterium]|nr:MAG: ArsR family transcriptional regulator [Bacteroidota bacterium]